jgi:hypothetical protein
MSSDDVRRIAEERAAERAKEQERQREREKGHTYNQRKEDPVKTTEWEKDK